MNNQLTVSAALNGGHTIPKNMVYLYAFGDPDGKTIKLGHSRNPVSRKKQHETRGPTTVEMTTLAVWRGTIADESYLKNHFKRLAIPNRKEWFSADDEMISWLQSMLKQTFVAPRGEGQGNIPYVDSSYWLPGKLTKFSKPPQMRLFDEHQDDPWGHVKPDQIGEGDFYSPQVLVEAARACFGGTIDLDPASCREANKVVQAKNFYSVAEDGLSQPYYGRMWMNPPFPWEPWAPKLMTEWKSGKGKIRSVIALCTTRVTTAAYFHPVVAASSAILKMCGRLAFWGPKAGAPDEGHELYYLGSEPDAFKRHFSRFGTVFQNERPT